MYYGRVVGHAVSTVKHASMQGQKLLLVKALRRDGVSIEGDPILVIDRLGAGQGDLVLITSDGIATREMLGRKDSPVRWSTLGIIDS